MTVVHPKRWTAAWTMRMPIPREDNYGFYEYACHEGNHAMFNLLRGCGPKKRACGGGERTSGLSLVLGESRSKPNGVLSSGTH